MKAWGVHFSRSELFRALLLGVAAVLVTSLAGLHCDSGYPRIGARYGFRTDATFEAGWGAGESGEILEYESPDVRKFRPGDSMTEFLKEYREALWASEARQWAYYDEYARGFPLEVVSYRVLISGPTGHHENLDPDQVRTFPEYRNFQIRWAGLGLNIVLWASLYLGCNAVVRNQRRKRWKRDGCCLKCGYSLHANTSGACPECGAVILVIPRVEAMIASIKQAYGDLDRPNYSFQERALKNLRRHPLVAEIQKRFPAKDITDLNDHQALHLHIHEPAGVMLCLSLVSPWAMVFRISPRDQLYECVIDRSATDLSALEINILSLLEQHGFTVVTREEAATPIRMNLFDTDRSDVRVYHALISDDGVVPAVLEG